MPKLRFPEFEGEWGTVKLSDFTERVTRKNSDNQTNLPLTISSKDGLVDQVTYFSKAVASKDMSGYYLLQNGEFAYNKSYSVGYDFGSIKRLDRYPMGALSTLYICFSLKKYDSDFIKVYFDSLKWYREIYIIAAEGARNHGLLNVPTEDFFQTRHILPNNIVEQKKIASFLTLLDARIAKQRELVENLKLYKRGLVSAIFSRKIRFQKATGENYPDWQTMKLSDIFSKISQRNIDNAISNVITNSAEFGLLPQIDYFDKEIANVENTSNYYVIQKNDFVYNPRKSNSAPYGPFNCYACNETGIISPLYTALHLKKQCNVEYLSWYFKSSLWHRYIYDNGSQGVRHDRVSMTDELLFGIPILIPYDEEQKKIAQYLSMLNAFVDSEERCLQAMVKIKDRLLSEIFI